MKLPDNCPKCGAENEHGYGLMGGGMGEYVFCSVEWCDFFQKVQDPSLRDPRVDPLPGDRIQLLNPNDPRVEASGAFMTCGEPLSEEGLATWRQLAKNGRVIRRAEDLGVLPE